MDVGGEQLSKFQYYLFCPPREGHVLQDCLEVTDGSTDSPEAQNSSNAIKLQVSISWHRLGEPGRFLLRNGYVWRARGHRRVLEGEERYKDAGFAG